MPPAASLAGRTILHYRVRRPIGSGGMGVVYEAEDTKLGRRVALKFLPPELARDAVAMERFTREARAASALNHPNICTIYAIEEAGDGRFIAMELLEGESLDRRIAGQPLAFDALVDTGVQIADALDAAHRRGIVHRDIKPANLFLTQDGRAKVLDFGVAKMDFQRVAQAETMGLATAEQALTGEGVAVGTIAYMSPEQARGEDADARSDIFSLAAVLYEVSTGHRAFDGRTSAVVFNKILEASPTAPRELNPTLPPKLEDVIVRGLEKDGELRYQTAADLRADLKRLKRDATNGKLAFVPAAPAAGGALPLSSGAVLRAEATRHKGLAGLVALIAVAIVSAAAYGVYALLRQTEGVPAAPAIAVQGTPERLTTTGDVQGCGSISPDGKYVVYCDFRRRLRLLQVGTGATVELGELVGDTTFSPDGNFVYVSEQSGRHPAGVLWAIPALGGREPRRVLTSLAGPVGVSPDGAQVAFVRHDAAKRESAVITADVRGGSERHVAVLPVSHGWFEGMGVSWSDDGALLSVTQGSAVGGFRLRPVTVDVATGSITPLGTRTWSDVGRTVWLPGRSGILFTAREHFAGPLQFWIARYPDGTATRITNDSRGFGNLSVSVTADGSTIATVPNEIVSNIWSTNTDATAPLERWTSARRFDGGLGLAVAASGPIFFASHDGSEAGIWSLDRRGGQPRKLTQGYAEQPVVPADGSYVAFLAIHENRFRVWRMDPDGGGVRPLSRGEDDIMPTVSPDGRWIYYWAAGAAKQPIERMSADGTARHTVTELPVQPVRVSPDGRTLLVRTYDPSLKASHLVLDAETGAILTRLDLNETRVGWGRTGDTVLYSLDREGVSNLWEQPIAGGEPRQLTRFTDGNIFAFSYTPDGTRLFIARGQRTGDVVVLRDFQ